MEPDLAQRCLVSRVEPNAPLPPWPVSAAGALTLTILAEVIHAMVLLAPQVYKYIISKGIAIGKANSKAEGKAEGIAIGEANMKQAIIDWFERKAAAERDNVPFNETAPWLT